MTENPDSDPADFRPSKAARAVAVGLAVLSLLVLIVVLFAARRAVQSAHPRAAPAESAEANGPAVKPYSPLQDEMRARMRAVTWPVVLAVTVGGVAYLAVICWGMVWVARDAGRRGMSSGTWVLVNLVGQLIFTSAALGFVLLPAVPEFALPLLPLGWIGLVIYLMLRRPLSA